MGVRPGECCCRSIRRASAGNPDRAYNELISSTVVAVVSINSSTFFSPIPAAMAFLTFSRSRECQPARQELTLLMN
jgi:hypothetical protein